MSSFYKIEEAVGGGHYIVLEGIFTTKEAAEAAMAKHRCNQDMRVTLYETGGWSGGPVRVKGGVDV